MTQRYIRGNDIRLLRNGTEYFPALESEIHAAQYEIYLETFIYDRDSTCSRITQALIAAAQRGLHVHLLLDGFGCRTFHAADLKLLRDAGVDVMFYRPKVSPWTLKRNRLRRLHRKVAVMDGKVAFVGGINVIDDMNVPGNNAPRVDYAVRVEGPLLPKIHRNIERLWRRIAWQHLHIPHTKVLPETTGAAIAGNMRAAFVMRDNVLHRRDIERMYLKAIGAAKHDILIANAYFVPGIKFRNALVEASKRGVRVRLLLQGRLEYIFLYASHAIYGRLLRHNIEIFEYRKSFMHSKVAVVDDRWATVGSSNIDPFSLLLAREANIAVLDSGFAKTLREDIEQSMADGAVQIQASEWEKRHFLRRGLSWIMFGFMRFFLGLIGYPNQH